MTRNRLCDRSSYSLLNTLNTAASKSSDLKLVNLTELGVSQFWLKILKKWKKSKVFQQYFSSLSTCLHVWRKQTDTSAPESLSLSHSILTFSISSVRALLSEVFFVITADIAVDVFVAERGIYVTDYALRRLSRKEGNKRSSDNCVCDLSVTRVRVSTLSPSSLKNNRRSVA